MPSSIPYDPSLILGNIVPQKKLDNLIEMSQILAPAEAAEEHLNALISLNRSYEMTLQEMINMGITPEKHWYDRYYNIKGEINDAANAYMVSKIEAENNLVPLRSKMNSINESIESPINYNKSAFKTLPIAADSFTMNCQYFSYDRNSETSDSFASTISGYVSREVNFLGNKASSQAKSSVQSQVHGQYSNHNIEGTLVISISCTHKNALMLAPLILDVDKAIRVWNGYYPNDKIKLDMAGIMRIALEENTRLEQSLNIISGATYGSSFVGMVHVLNTTKTRSFEAMQSIAGSIQAQASQASWFQSMKGGFGMDSSFSNDIKNMLSTQKITSHCSLNCMGVIPNIASNEVSLAVKGFSDSDAAQSMEKLKQLQNATAGDLTTMDSAAESARTGGQMVALKVGEVNGLLSGLSNIDDKSNKIIDINSLMKAMTDYINKCSTYEENKPPAGIPINYYLKPITKSQLAQMWVSKYYPNNGYLNISGDDSENTNPSGQKTTDTADSE